MSKLSKEKIIKKWSIIMDHLNIKDAKKRDFLSEYAEHHAINELNGFGQYNPNLSLHKKIPKIIRPDIDPYGEEDWGDTSEQIEYKNEMEAPNNNMLPTSLKILSRLNLDGKNLSIEEGLPKITINMSITQQQIDDLRFGLGGNPIKLIEDKLIDELVYCVNKQLETHDNLKVNLMAQSIKTTAVESFTPIITLTGSFQVD